MPIRHLPYIILSISLSTSSVLFAQIDSLNNTTTDNQVLLEDLLQNSGVEADFDFNTLFEDLAYYREHPISLNEATTEQLSALNILSPVQINDFIQHRARTGALLALYELQAISSFDAATIQALLPYVTLKNAVDDYQVPIFKMLAEGKNELYLRWYRNLQEQRGFTEEVSPQNQFLGDQNRLYARYKHSYENRLQYGITMEKDAGEPLFTSVNQDEGFDFYSAHIFLKNYNKNIRAVALGDYSVSLGQGLIIHSGFGYGKSNLVMDIKKTAAALRPYSSVSEAGFMRGGGVTLNFGDNIETTAFASYRGVDGNLLEADTIDGLADEVIGFTSLLVNGLHRNLNEVAKQNTILQTTFGGSVKYKTRSFHIALNGIYDQFNRPLSPTPQPYNLYFFRGESWYNFSVDYSYIYKNINFFGETALDQNGALATMNAALIGLDRKIDFAILHRHYAKDYVALNANGFGESTAVRNEDGFYVGMAVRPAARWEWTGYFDVYKHPWLRFRTDGPSSGFDWRTRLRFYKKRDVEAYLQVRQEIKQQNAPNNETKTDFLAPNRIFQARLHLSKKISKELEVRTRLDWGYTDNGEGTERSDGFAILQDVIYRPIAFPISFTTRYALFDTDGFATRFYHYENNLLYTFSIPAYYNRGSRFYINVRYRGIRNLTLEARYEQTYWKNQDRFGSGVNQIDGNVRSAVSAQVKYKF
ncbi:MAG: helix-hairpin-helix domain-containing protein [Bacteroidota bacterium]